MSKVKGMQPASNDAALEPHRLGGECIESGASQWLQNKRAAMHMNASACVLVSGVPNSVSKHMLEEHFIEVGVHGQIRQVVIHSGLALIEFAETEHAAKALVVKQHMFGEALLQVRGMPPTFSRKKGGGKASRRHLSPLTTRRETPPQILMRKEHEPQLVLNGNKSLETIREVVREREDSRCSTDECKRLEEENNHLKNQTEADKTKIERLEAELIREREANRCPLDKCQRLEEETNHLKNQREANRIKIEQLEAELVRGREANRCSVDKCERLEKENNHLRNKAEVGKTKIEQLEAELMRERDKFQKLEEGAAHMQHLAEADKREIERLNSELLRENVSKACGNDLCQKLEERADHQANQDEDYESGFNQLLAELSREIKAKRCAFDLCRRMEEENISLKNQTETAQREIAQMKQQIASPFNATSSFYEMIHVPRGVAVIINNIHFEDMANRDGAEADTDRLRNTFEGIGFTVMTFHDLDHSKMVDVMMEQGKADHSNYDCFVCCVMSHGTLGKVFSSTDVGIDICEMIKPVNAKRCPSLKGKPKLFFIQACQGEKRQGREGDDGDHDAKPVPFICHEADFFLGLSTVPGYVARRDHDGAPYIQNLTKMLKEFGQTHDLCTIMAMVCDRMNDIDKDGCGWISSNHSTLRKKIIFTKQETFV